MVMIPTKYNRVRTNIMVNIPAMFTYPTKELDRNSLLWMYIIRSQQ